MNRNVLSVTVVVALLLSGCKLLSDKATFLDNKRLYVKNAEAQAKTGNWDNARRTYTLALNNAQWAEDKPQELAKLNYEVGRANGVTCRYDMAEQHLTDAYELDKQTSGPVYRSLNELGRLNLAQNKYPEAIGFFERAMPELETAKVASRDPIDVADALTDYATALEKGGKASQAAQIASRASDLRAKNAGKAAGAVRAPYGTQCAEQKS